MNIMKNNIIILLFVTVCSAANAQRYFLKVEGPNINGVNEAPPHTEVFILNNFSFSISNDGTTHVGGGGGGGKSQSGPIEITLPFNEPNNKLYEAVHTGQNFNKITIFVRKYFSASGQVPAGEKDYLIYTFEKVKFSSATSSYVDGAGIPSMQLVFKAGIFKMDFYKTENDGSRSTTVAKAIYNFLTNLAN